MKKTILAGFIIVLYIILSVSTTSAGLSLSKHDRLTAEEGAMVEKVTNRISNILIFEKNCDAKIRYTVLDKIETKKEFYQNSDGIYDRKKFLMYAYIEREVLRETSKCDEEIVDDDFFIDNIFLIETPQPTASKKGSHHSYLGADIELRTSTSYIYFYHNDTLINTVDKKFKNDVGAIHDLLGRKQISHDNLLDDSETSAKTSLYSAKYLDDFNKNRQYIHFTKKDDNGTRNFIYDIHSDKWFDLGFEDVIHFHSLGANRYYYLAVDSYKNYEMRDETLAYIIVPNEDRQIYMGSIYAEGTLQSFLHLTSGGISLKIRDANGNVHTKYFDTLNY